jgi:hypothetical protein
MLLDDFIWRKNVFERVNRLSPRYPNVLFQSPFQCPPIDLPGEAACRVAIDYLWICIFPLKFFFENDDISDESAPRDKRATLRIAPMIFALRIDGLETKSKLLEIIIYDLMK